VAFGSFFSVSDMVGVKPERALRNSRWEKVGGE